MAGWLIVSNASKAYTILCRSQPAPEVLVLNFGMKIIFTPCQNQLGTNQHNSGTVSLGVDIAGRTIDGYQNFSSLTVETWAATTFQPSSGNRTQV